MQYYTDKDRRNKKRWVDFDFAFDAHPNTGDLVLKKDIASVAQSVRNLVQTSRFERVFQPSINSRVRSMLFEPLTPASIMQLRSNITDVLVHHEPRIKVVDVRIVSRPDKNHVDITIQYLIRSLGEVIETGFSLKRLR